MAKEEYLSELRAGLEAIGEGDASAVPGRSGLALISQDATHRRVVEGAANQLELQVTVVDADALQAANLARFELVLVDTALAELARKALAEAEGAEEGLNPAVVVLCEPGTTPDCHDRNPPDGVLTLPAPPAEVSAQLSLILYAHRAFARRYETALEELHLNRRIFRSVTSGISVANAMLDDLPLVYVNPAFEVMTGYCLEEVQGQNCRFLQGAERDQPAVPLLRQAIADRREIVVLLKNFRKDGAAFWNELSLSPIRNRDGVVTHFVGIQSDVTARVEFEAALRESEKLAAVGRLASSIAHEINNPLESVMNLLYLATQALPADQANEESARYLALADKELQRVSSIASQSLRFYKQSTKPQAITANEMVDSVLDLYDGRADNARVRIERRERSRQPVVCLESEIRQVLNNLVRNAIDAMHGAGGRLLVRTREATDWRTGAPGVLLTVGDTGSGISPQTLKDLYRPFFTTKGIAGTGLGLWISSEIVQRHGGRLRVRSQQPRDGQPGGTVFTLFLPRQPDFAA